MARIFITGSADGLGLGAAQALLEDGHEVVVHTRSSERLTALRELLGPWPPVVLTPTTSDAATSASKPANPAISR